MCISIPFYLSHTKNEKRPGDSKPQSNTNFKLIESNSDTIDQDEIPFDEMEPEQYDKNQIFIENVDLIYKYFSFKQGNQIEDKLVSYVRDYLKDTKKCSVSDVTVNNNDGTYTIKINLDGSSLKIVVTKDDKGMITDILLYQS
jgi:hypothetical protein